MITRRAALALPTGLIAAHAYAAPLAATPIARLDTRWWRERHEEKLAELSRVRPQLIWLGDSITQNFERNGPEPWAHFAAIWQQFYAPYRAVNLGFKGDATSHLLWRIIHGELDGIAPRVAIMLIGANNLGRLHWSAADTVTGIATLIDEVRRRLPATGLVLLSVLPSHRSDWASSTTAQINSELHQRYAESNTVRFVDVTDLFMRNGSFDSGLFYDPRLSPPEPALHPTDVGMTKIATRLQPLVTRLMKT